MIDTLRDETSLGKPSTQAARAAARNFTANLRAIRSTQPALANTAGLLPPDVEWVFARDGTLTALDADGKWWAGCSLPHRAAQFMLKKAELDGTLLCFLYPTHAAQLRVTLDRAKPGQALLALTPIETILPMLLACEDFSSEIDSHRLYFAAGAQWESQLDSLFEELPGLPTPTQFIRPILADSSPADEMIAPAQKIFANHSERRAERVRTLRQSWTSTGLRRICLVAPALFRLWDDAGEALSRAMETCADGITIRRFNPDDPAGASSAALAAAAASCEAIVTPNMGRGDLPDLIPNEMPWATWVTTPRIPSAEKARAHDTLLIADPGWKVVAMEKGWKSHQIFLAGWPLAGSQTEVTAAISAPDKSLNGILDVSYHGRPARTVLNRDTGGTPVIRDLNPRESFLAIISDTQPLEAPARVIEYSSHRLLWESIERELSENPFILSGSTDRFLASRMERAHIDEQGFDRAAFLDGVVLHAWQQSLARLLIREGFPIKLFGQGWEKLDEFSRFARGPIRSRTELVSIVDSSTALIHTWPTHYAHPIDATGKPVIRPGKRREAFIRDARLALEGRYPVQKRGREVLTAAVVLRSLSQTEMDT